MRPGRLDLAGGRFVPFVQTITMRNIDLTGAAFLSHVRLGPDASGTPLIALETVASSDLEGVSLYFAGVATIADHIAAGRLRTVPEGQALTDLIAISILNIRISETTMEGLPLSSPPEADAVFAWDMHITPLGGIKQKWLGGRFTVEAGVTQ